MNTPEWVGVAVIQNSVIIVPRCFHVPELWTVLLQRLVHSVGEELENRINFLFDSMRW